MHIYFVLFACGVVGIVGHTLQKMREINLLTPTLKPKQVIEEFVKAEWLTTVMSLFAVGVCLILASEIFAIRQTHEAEEKSATFSWLWWVGAFTKTIFIFIGYVGQRGLYKVFGRVEQRLGDKIEKI